MITHRTRGLQSLLIVSQIGLFLLLYWVWFAGSLFWNPIEGNLALRPYSAYCFWLVLGLFAEWVNRNKDRTTLYELSLLKHAPVASRQTTFAFVSLLFYIAFTKDRFISRAFLFSLLPSAYFLLLWTNHALPEFFVKKLFRGVREIRTLLVGSCASAEKLRVWLERKARFGFHTVGILTDDPPPHETSWPVLGTTDSLDQVIGREAVAQVILLNFARQPSVSRALIATAEARGVRTLLLSNIEDMLLRKVTVFEEDGQRFITLHEEPLENPLNRSLKRTLDFSLSLLVAIFILPPLCVIVWMLQRLQSPGPLFHKQTRAGLQNREFTILKFRTMHDGRGQIEKQASEDDDRIFPAGRWLRRFSLDEFPQFLNVLHGEMSIVGPRPHLVEHNQQFARVMDGYHLRTFVKPGITGLAQVRGFRGEANTVEDIEARLQSDMVYLENWSAPLDLAIALRTAWQLVFPPKTAR